MTTPALVVGNACRERPCRRSEGNSENRAQRGPRSTSDCVGATSAKHDLVFTHVEAAERVHVLDLQCVPRNIDDALRLVVDEVMMRRQFWIEHDLAFGEHELAK